MYVLEPRVVVTRPAVLQAERRGHVPCGAVLDVSLSVGTAPCPILFFFQMPCHRVQLREAVLGACLLPALDGTWDAQVLLESVGLT